MQKKREEDIDKIDEIRRQKRKMNEDDMEEFIGVIVPAVAALCQVKEKKEKA